MRLLFDQNLAPRLVQTLSDVFPNSEHVATMALDRASDVEVAHYAGQHGLLVVTKDADFVELAQASSAEMKVVWLRIGNCTTAELETVLRAGAEPIARLAADPDAKVLLLE